MGAPAVGFLVAALLALATACGDGGEGDERSDAPRQTPTPATTTGPATATATATAAPGPRTAFSRALGDLCSGFFAEAGRLQGRLRALNASQSSPAPLRRRSLALVARIQARTAQFLQDAREVPLPRAPEDRRNAREFLASGASFLQLQRDSNGLIRRVLAGESGPEAQALLGQVQGQLNSELAKQRDLARRLNAPECLPPSG